MLRGLQAIFNGESIADQLPELKAKGFDLIRCDCGKGNGPQIAREVLDAGMIPLIIVLNAEQIRELPKGAQVELGNEPDLETDKWPTPEDYIDAATRSIVAAGHDYPLWIGAVSNLNRRGFAYLDRLPWQYIPPYVGCSVHRYPDPSGPQRSHLKRLFPWQKRYTRDDEIAELKRIVNPDPKRGVRPLALTEIGYNQVDFTEQEAADYMATERAFFAGHGFSCAVAYQLNDGTGPEPIDHYGFRRTDDTWKPVLEAWTS